jgi:NUMOD3 motif
MVLKPGHTPWNKGRRLSEEHRIKISDSHKGKPSSTKGRTISQEHKDKISLANTGRKHTLEEREHISKGLTAFFKARRSQRRSESLLKYYQENEVWNKGKPWPVEIRQKIREGCLNSKIGMGPRAPWSGIRGNQ